MTRIEEALGEFNPWWKKNGDFAANYKDRDIYSHIRKFMPMRHIIALTGLRRVGKTTLMHKIIEDTIKEGMDPRHIVYFSFDEFRDAEIRDIAAAYEELLEKDAGMGRHLFLFDEIQKLRGWEDQLKVIYDTWGKGNKIIISGSESLFIRRKSKETLAGRMFDFRIDPLTFREFLSFKGMDAKQLKPSGLYRKELARLFREFTMTMGFPELVGISEKEVIRKYIKESIVEKVIYRDMQGLFEIRDVSIIDSLLNIFMEYPGQVVEISELAGQLKISRQTLSTYLSYLEDSFLIRKLYNFSRNRRKSERKLKKYYPTVVSPDLLFREDDTSRSRVFEWLVVSQLKAEFFWRDNYQNEVDVIIAGKGIVPIEIKYGKTDIKGLLAFMKKFGVSRGLIITPASEENRTINGKQISIMPAFKYFS